MNKQYLKEYNYEKLEFLRRNTKLNPKAYLKVFKKKLEADKEQKIYNKYEPNDHIGVDYSEANLLEFGLRMQAWENKYKNVWQEYGHGYTLEEYILMALDGFMNEEKQNKR